MKILIYVLLTSTIVFAGIAMYNEKSWSNISAFLASIATLVASIGEAVVNKNKQSVNMRAGANSRQNNAGGNITIN